MRGLRVGLVAIRDCSPPFGPRRSRELLELRARIRPPKWVDRENTARQSANERAFPFLRINALPLDRVMFEAADPDVFAYA